MVSKIYSLQKAVDYLPDTIVIPDCVLLTPITDNIISGDFLGHLIVCPGHQMVVYDGVVTGKTALSNKSIGSFLFIGNNPKYFNHLFKNLITGKYTIDKTIQLDTKSSMASYEMVHIIKENITNHWEHLHV